MKYIITESKLTHVIQKFLHSQFPSLNEISYDWANYNCGMGICCDPNAIGFTLPEDDFEDYLFKLVHSENYYNEKLYRSYSEDLPEPCYSQPDIQDPRFDSYTVSEKISEPFDDFFGGINNWDRQLLHVLNKKFGTNAKRLNTYY